MTSPSPSEDDDPEDPENPSGKKKKKRRKSKRHEGRRSQEAKATATSKVLVNLPEFTRKELSEFAENSGRSLGERNAICSCSAARPSTWRGRSSRF